jgi:hypothetical protein
VHADRRRFAGHRNTWALGGIGVVILGITLGLVFGVFLDESPSHANARATMDPPSGLGPATKVANPPEPGSVVAGESVAGNRPTGPCWVDIRNNYDKYDWQQQTDCGKNWGTEAELVTLRNDSKLTVFANEWYAGAWHGETPISAGQTVVMPLWGSIFHTALRLGTCWQGPGGPGTCQGGPADQRAKVEVVNWDSVPTHRARGLMFVREENGIGAPGLHGSKYTAANVGRYPVQLHWPALGRGRWVDLPAQGKIENIPPGDVEGRKEFGTGAVALVQLIPTPHEDGPDLYFLVPGSGDTALMTFLDGSWCSATIQNLSNNRVILTSWHVPYISTSGGLSLDPGASGTIVMKQPTLLITGIVGLPNPRGFATLKATNWKKCP